MEDYIMERNISTINLIKFDRSSMNLINQNKEAYLIIDYLFEEG